MTKQIFLILLLCLGCSERQPTLVAQKTFDADAVRYEIPLRLKSPANLTADEERLALQLENGQPVSFSGVTRLLLARQIQEARFPKVALSQLEDWVKALTPTTFSNRGQLKIAYEDALERLNPARPLLLNSGKMNLVDIFRENRLQSFSGTLLYQIIRRQMGPQAFREASEVVIFSEAHVQPGYMVLAKNQYKLIGLETTLKGGARTLYGTSGQLPSNLRVIDAELFAVIELLQPALANPLEAAQEALEQTARRYQIPLHTLKGMTPALSTAARLQLHDSVFAFGEAAPDWQEDAPREVSLDDGTRSDAELFGIRPSPYSRFTP